MNAAKETVTSADGALSSKEMLRRECRPGYWWVNVAPLGETPAWTEQVQPHKSRYLFGHEPAELLAKQYRRPFSSVSSPLEK